MEPLPARLTADEPKAGPINHGPRPDLRPLLAPRSIAFVGASAKANTPGHDMLRMIHRGGFTGTAYAVNPRGGAAIEGFRCLPRLADLPSPPDLAVLSVRNERLEDAFGEAVAVGARAAVIFASGQLGEEASPSLSERLAALAREAGMPVCGPNGMGFYNDLDRVWICGFPSPREPKPGSIALIAHSGSVFGALAHNDPRLRFALAVSPGQELTATVADYLAYAVERPEVKVIGLFIETARDPHGFRDALAAAARRRVPVVALKVGRTEASAAAALTHTGALAGSDDAYGALFDRYGVVRVETLDELAATLLLLSTGRRAAPGGLVSIHDSGGERELLIDLADRAGVAFAAIGPDTKAAIASRLDPGLAAENPLDAWGTGADFAAQFEGCFGALVDDEAAALGLFCADIRDGYYLSDGFAAAAAAVAGRTDKPVALATNYTQVRHDALALSLTEAGVPVLDGTLHALTAVRGALSVRDFQARPDDPPPEPPACRAAHRAGARRGLFHSPVLTEVEGLALLSAWGLPVVPHRAVDDADVAVLAAEEIGWPVVLKTAAPGILHKSDAAGVHLGLDGEAALRAAYEDLSARLGPQALVARMVPRGVELALGAVRDPQFGPVVTVGAGGVLVELLGERRSALPPFGIATARRLIDGLNLRPLLDGYRGGPPVELPALARTVALFSVLVAELADVVAEIDVNPLICGPATAAVDALVVARKPDHPWT